MCYPPQPPDTNLHKHPPPRPLSHAVLIYLLPCACFLEALALSGMEGAGARFTVSFLR